MDWPAVQPCPAAQGSSRNSPASPEMPHGVAMCSSEHPGRSRGPLGVEGIIGRSRCQVGHMAGVAPRLQAHPTSLLRSCLLVS